jgi:hypothetical protein
MNIPTLFQILTDDDHAFFSKMCAKMASKVSDYTIKKNNVGVQENVKYPREYRDAINSRFIHIIGSSVTEKDFDLVHSNMALEVNV